jgi:hypothetical protein
MDPALQQTTGEKGGLGYRFNINVMKLQSRYRMNDHATDPVKTESYESPSTGWSFQAPAFHPRPVPPATPLEPPPKGSNAA